MIVGTVRFDGASEVQIAWGHNDDPNKVLTVGTIYDVEDIDVRSSHTKIRLFGIEGWFNDASFTYADPSVKENAIRNYKPSWLRGINAKS